MLGSEHGGFMSAHLVKFIVASSGGQEVLINPALVRCIYGSTGHASSVVSIVFGDGEDGFVRVESNLEEVAKALGFKIENA
jgi:hypothetical protein